MFSTVLLYLFSAEIKLLNFEESKIVDRDLSEKKIHEFSANELFFLSVARDCEKLSASSTIRLKTLILNFFSEENRTN